MKLSTTIAPLILVFLTISIAAQTVVLEATPADSGRVQKFGPNRQHYIHSYFALGMPIGRSAENVKVMPRVSDSQFGVRYKLKLGEGLATGFDFGYQSHSYTIKQEPGKSLFDTVLYDRERITFGYLFLGPYLRVQPGKRGDVIGRFIDIGAKGGYRINSSHFVRSNLDDGSILKMTRARLQDTEPFYWGAFARIGFNAIAFYFEYMGSTHFTIGPDFPTFTFGLQINLN